MAAVDIELVGIASWFVNDDGHGVLVEQNFGPALDQSRSFFAC